MNFDFSEDQKYIQGQARDFLTAECGPAVVRRVLEGDSQYDRDLWQQILQLGWPATAIAEAHGGLGLSYLEQCVIATELGRALAPVPFIASVYLATEAIKLGASTDQQAEWLPKLAAGEWIGTVAACEQPGAFRPEQVSASVENGRLSGRKLPVLHGQVAERAVVVARGGGELGLFLVDLGDSSVRRRGVDSVDPTQPLAELVFDRSPAIRLAGGTDTAAALTTLFNRAAVLLAFEQVGGAEAALDMARAYTCNRYAFGRQVASFQAIKHKLADMFVAIELAKSNAYYGAWALTAGADELPLAAATARVSAIDAYYLASKENIQAHGGMGFTWEFDCHLYYRRAQALSLLLGGNPYWKNQLVERLLAA